MEDGSTFHEDDDDEIAEVVAAMLETKRQCLVDDNTPSKNGADKDTTDISATETCAADEENQEYTIQSQQVGPNHTLYFL